MARFSVSGAATSGFGVIGREPVAVLTWGALILLVLILPFAGLGWAVVPDFVAFVKAGAASQGSPEMDPQMMTRLMQMQTKMTLFNLVYWLGGTLVKAVIAAAVFRIVLEPDQKGFAFLRLGAQELWLGLVFLVMGVLAYLVCLVAMLAVAILAGLAYVFGAMANPEAGAASCILVAVLAGLVATGAVVWAMLRLSMAGPMSFSERKFLLFEAWPLTRGQAWPLLGMVLLLALIVIALEMVVYGVAGVGFLAFSSTLIPMFEGLAKQPPEAWVRALWPLAAGVAVLGSLLAGPAMALIFAPWATAYRDLRATPAT
ncbi:hypothetical protein PMI01_01064 [Caulobacter sp. AP07]|uniref:hypothetical protein n=1 Tax=Caulobacter sp. AP07 TaxID=1144304 RepID=UPI000271DE63|nr:hypothetical protein [Caulobacter sp. AP07]EJL36218.1 hypothetical protein PMI01_01064 [Caulobacter sp. AP07]